MTKSLNRDEMILDLLWEVALLSGMHYWHQDTAARVAGLAAPLMRGVQPGTDAMTFMTLQARGRVAGALELPPWD